MKLQLNLKDFTYLSEFEKPPGNVIGINPSNGLYVVKDEDIFDEQRDPTYPPSDETEKKTSR